MHNEARRGPEGTALSHTFHGNRDAAGASFGAMDAVPIALQSYVRALEADPDFTPAKANLEWLLSTEAGAWAAAELSGDDPWMQRLQELAGSER